MYWGLLACSFVAFSAATEFIPEMNQKLKLVPFSSEFKMTLIVLMVVDYMACWIVERVLKAAFSDYRPKDIAIRRPEQEEVEAKRKKEEAESAEKERIEAIEKKLGKI